MSKLISTLIAAVFAVTTFGAVAQTPPAKDAPKAAPATPATPASPAADSPKADKKGGKAEAKKTEGKKKSTTKKSKSTKKKADAPKADAPKQGCFRFPLRDGKRTKAGNPRLFLLAGLIPSRHALHRFENGSDVYASGAALAW